MDSFYDAEISEFFGMHELYSISNKLEKQSTELYKMIDWQFWDILLNRIWKYDMIWIFKNPGFKTEIKTNLTLDLLDGTYKPYKNSND